MCIDITNLAIFSLNIKPQKIDIHIINPNKYMFSEPISS